MKIKGGLDMCIVALRSMTYAIKGKNVLNDNYIDCEIVRLDPKMTSKGCAYGLKFSCVNLYNVQSALATKSIKYSEIIRQ